MTLMSTVLLIGLVKQTPTNVLLNSDFKNGMTGWATNSSPVEMKDPSGSKYFRFSIPTKMANPWDVMVSQPFPVDLPNGYPVTLRVTARSTTNNRINAMIEEQTAPYTKYLSKEISLSPNWDTYTVTGNLEQGAGVQATIHMSLDKGSVDIKEFSVLSSAPVAPTRDYPFEYLKNSRFENGLEHWTPEGSAKPVATLIDVSGQSFKKAIRLTYSNKDGNPWDSQIGQAIDEESAKGNTVHAKVWLRSDDKLQVSMVYEMNTPPHDKAIFETITPNSKWAEYKLPLRLQNGYRKNGSQFKLFLQGKGMVEVGPLSLMNYGKNVTNGSLDTFLTGASYEPDLAWRKEANAKIEKIRKGDMTVTLVDAKGKPLKNTSVNIQQVTHNFRFGTAAPASLITQRSKDGDEYRKVLKRFFNTITFENDLKWYKDDLSVFENPIAPATKWIKDNGMELRGHCLVWGSFRNLPPGMDKKNKEETWNEVKNHVVEYSKRMKGQLYLWDVVNEAVTETELWDKIGWDKFAEVYKIARANDPKVKLAYNDFNITTSDKHRATAIARTKAIQSYGAPIDVFGDQSHLGAPGVPPRKLWTIWDEVHSQTGLPLEVTEFDFSSMNDSFQAAYMADFYRAAFSHPKMQAIIVWGFWQNAHWLGQRGGHMVNADWKWRPSMTTIDNLLNKEWKTSGTFKTDANGKIKLRGFYGKYALTVGTKVSNLLHTSNGATYTIR